MKEALQILFPGLEIKIGADSLGPFNEPWMEFNYQNKKFKYPNYDERTTLYAFLKWLVEDVIG